jgi:hypothetical protein
MNTNRRYSILAACVVALLSLLATQTAAAADPFTIAFLPDTQHYVDNPDNVYHFNNQTQWIVDNRVSNNIAFVTHTGDIVDNQLVPIEWTRADTAMDILDIGAPDLPYGILPGNKDYDSDWNVNAGATNYTANFGSTRYAGKSWYGGASPDDRNHYQTFSGGGREFLNISLEWKGVSAENTNQTEIIDWAQGVLDANPDTPTIISTHEYLATSGRTAVGNDVFNNLVKDNSQVFLVLGSHLLGESHQTSQNAAGDDVFEILADYQGRTEGGTGWMQLIKFDEENSSINVTTYSPSLGQFETDSNSQFSFAVDFDDRFGQVPEPTSMLLLLTAVVPVILRRRRRA